MRKKLLVFLSALLLIMFGLSFFPDWIERAYSQGLYPVLARSMQGLSGRVGFPVGDLVYGALALFVPLLVLLIGVMLLRKQVPAARRLTVIGLNTVLTAAVLFYIFWGMNYFRRPAAARFALDAECCAIADIREIAGMMVDSVNRYREFLPDGFKVAKTDLRAGGIRAVKALSAARAGFPVYAPAIKPSLFGDLVSRLGTAGYYNPLTSESQINDRMPLPGKPFTICHELSHQMGFASEDEASFAGFLASVNSREPLFRYSAYYSVANDYLFELRLRDTVAFKSLRARLSPKVLGDFRHERTYWRSFHGKTTELSSAFYDRYLKFNNQENGLKTYNEVVRLITGWYRKEGTWLLR